MKKTKKSQAETSVIMDQWMQHFESNFRLAQNADNPDAKMWNLMADMTKKTEIFSHENKFLKQLEKKKEQNKEIFSITHEEDKPHICKQIKFRQFCQIEYY